jgi:hypothetical protein
MSRNVSRYAHLCIFWFLLGYAYTALLCIRATAALVQAGPAQRYWGKKGLTSETTSTTLRPLQLARTHKKFTMVRTGGATLPKRNWQSYQSVAGTEADAKEDEVVHLNFKGKRELRKSESQILAQLVEDDDSPDALAALQLRVKRAAVCIVNALKGHGSGVHPNAMDLRHYRSMRVFHNSRPIRIANAALFMGICFMERPSWCYDRECLHELGGQVPMWPLPLLAVGTTVCLETVCLLIWAAEVYLMYDYGGFSEFGAEHAQLPVRVGLLTIASCDAVWTAFDPGHFRVGMYLRPLIVVAFSAKLQHSFANIARVLPKVANVALLLLFQLLLFGCVGTLLFQDFPESALFFKNFHDAYLNLFVLLSTANNPRVMVPAYHHSRPSCLFFVSFLCLGFFFLMNLLLATIFGNYKVVLHIHILRACTALHSPTPHCQSLPAVHMHCAAPPSPHYCRHRRSCRQTGSHGSSSGAAPSPRPSSCFRVTRRTPNAQPRSSTARRWWWRCGRTTACRWPASPAPRGAASCGS